MIYRILTVDAMGMLVRAWKGGGRQALVQGLLSRLATWHTDEQIGQVLIAWEGPPGPRERGGFRRQIWPEYKAGRPPLDAACIRDIEELREMLPAAGVLQAWTEGGEADDVAASVALDWPGPHLLWSGDKDWLQLISATCHLLRPDISRRPADAGEDWRRQPDTLLDHENLVDCTGWNARQWMDLLTLAGDKTDNIPGLPGVGLTRAGRLLSACPGLVELVLSGRGDEARAAVLAADVSLAKYAVLASEHRAELAASRELVQLRSLPLVVVDAAPDPDRILEWLCAQGWEEYAAWLSPQLPRAAEVELPF